MIVKTNVKLNLGLCVLRKRADGFHDIETLFVPCFDFGDTLEIITGDDYSRTSAALFAKYGGPDGRIDKLSDQPGHLCSSAIGMTEPAKPDTIDDLKTILAMPVSEWKDKLLNDFEATVFKAHPELAAIKQSLYDSGAVYASMSGSGSALFALYKK